MSNSAITFSIVNQKGGVGKTTSAINLATAFAQRSKKVLIIDMDPQGNASTGLGIGYDNRQNTIYETLINQCNIDDAIIKTKVKNLDIITSTVDLSGIEVEMANYHNREFLLKDKIDRIENKYDYIFIDCPPSLGLLTINTLCATDYILIPMQCEFFSLEGLSHLLTTLELVRDNLNSNLKIAGIMLTMHDRRNKLTEAVENDVRSYIGEKVFKNIVPRNIRLSEAPSHGMPGILYDSKCKGSIAYKKLAFEILGKEFSNVSRETKLNNKNEAKRI